MMTFLLFLPIIKYIPLQQGLRPLYSRFLYSIFSIIKYIPLQQGLRLHVEYDPK